MDLMNSFLKLISDRIESRHYKKKKYMAKTTLKISLKQDWICGVGRD